MKGTSAVTAALAVSILVLLPAAIHAQCNAKPAKEVAPKAIPNILNAYKAGWKLTAEINDEKEKSTFYLIEYYDPATKEGFLKFQEKDGEDLNLYYISTTREIFLYTGRECKVASLQSPPKPVDALIHEWSSWRGNTTILGPSALFVKAWMSQSKELYYQGNSDPIRGISSLQWAACYPGDTEPTRVWFADVEASPGYGTLKSLPLRIKAAPQTIDIMMMQPYPYDVDEVFKIPMGKGCQRLTKDVPAPPNFSNLDLEFHVEMAFTNPTELGKDHYLSHLEIIRDQKDSLISVIGADWQSAERVIHSPIVNMQRIYDYGNGHVYSYVDSSGMVGCKIEAVKDVIPNIQLPDKSEINMLDTILPTYKALENASYLGIHQVRGMPTHTFELVTGPMPVRSGHLTHAVITYNFLVKDEIYDTSVNQRNLPVRVSMYAYAFGNDKQPYFYFFGNIHDITTDLRDLNVKMNVKNCYFEEDDSKFTWVQLGFPATEKILLLAANRGNIKRRFLAELQRATRLSPLRVPDILVDFTENMVYVTALILEHPAIPADYKEVPNKKIKEPEWSEGVITYEECLKTCSSKHYKECRAVSHCGSFCATTSKDISAPDVLENSVECNTYAKTEDSKSRNVVLTRDAIDDLEEAIERNEFKFVVEHLDTRMTIATLVAETIEFSTGGLRDMFGEKNSDRRHEHQLGGSVPKDFSNTAVGSSLKPSDSYAMHVGSFPLEDCADICRDREDCFAFSSCLVSKQCIISTESRWPRAADMELKSDCTVFSKTYQSSFEELPGICYSIGARKYVNVSMSSECAAMCLREKEFVCKAFDFCMLSRKGKPACRLQDKHILEVADPADLDRSNAEGCSHYTRKHINDYRKTRMTRLLGNAHTVIKKVSEAECARQCWEASFPCQQFDHCTGTQDLGKGDCLLFDAEAGPHGVVTSPICSSYEYTGNYDRPIARAAEALHSNAKATGLSFFMIFLGVGLGVLALFAYGFYKTRRAGPAAA
ncbi:uncharacterized protein LOC144108894 [Amblyomma americanum]